MTMNMLDHNVGMIFYMVGPKLYPFLKCARAACNGLNYNSFTRRTQDNFNFYPIHLSITISSIFYAEDY